MRSTLKPVAGFFGAASVAGAGVPMLSCQGARRISSEAGTMIATAPTAIQNMALRQPICSMRKAASGLMVIGATPPPSDTSETASERCLSNQPSVAAMIGAKKAPPEAPISPP